MINTAKCLLSSFEFSAFELHILGSSMDKTNYKTVIAQFENWFADHYCASVLHYYVQRAIYEGRLPFSIVEEVANKCGNTPFFPYRPALDKLGPNVRIALLRDDISFLSTEKLDKQLLNLCAQDGALKCFKYVISSIEPDGTTLMSAIEGNNTEIVHIVADKVGLRRETFRDAILYGHMDVAEWVLNHLNEEVDESYLKSSFMFAVMNILKK